MVLVTGASGFVGRSMCLALASHGRQVRKVVRESNDPTCMAVGDIDANTDWTDALVGVDIVVHLAARVHEIRDNAQDSLVAFRRVNVEGTRHLAEQAAEIGVRRFLFVSSIKVNGDSSMPHVPFRSTDIPEPVDDYGRSKAEAEAVLRDIAHRTGMEVVIIRPPLIYGPGAKGNFARLVQLVSMGVPLPFASVENLRSIVSLDNLLDLMFRCLEHPSASGQIFLVSDGKDLSTPDLVREIARGLNRKVRLFAFPPKLLKVCGGAIGRAEEIDRLICSLQVDIRFTCELLDWLPPLSVGEGLRRACRI